MKRAFVTAVFLLAACAAPAVNPPSAPAPAASPPPPQFPPPPASYAPPRPPYPIATPENHDRCGAGALQWLVGRSKLEIPVPLEPGRRRVLCTTCPMTRDFNEFRQTVLFDAISGRVTSVACN